MFAMMYEHIDPSLSGNVYFFPNQVVYEDLLQPFSMIILVTTYLA